MEAVWEKPVIVFFREKLSKPETEPFAVVKARRLTVNRSDKTGAYKGKITDFFTYMGDVDVISPAKSPYVLCWMDDREDDFGKAWRRLTGVTFPRGLSFKVKAGKRTYQAAFEAKHAKLE
ncbi:hypothetical protein [Candidatus Hecatella orcuttiae]|jgi:hypothetical protein|uniref:hypothetical protein n=1 Tax=Candidatus Hecatella orcuttiae TaxID=1935119 RepID=UPI0028682662|nr:hypothetical protein [Candidatus Hecatella orcuttiae]